MMKKDDRLIENIRQVLDQSLEELDAATQSQLTQARHQALARQQQKKLPFWIWGSAPVAALLLLVIVLSWPTAPLAPVAAPVFDELSILSATEPLEFYQEDIEFYEWLSEVLETEKEFAEQPAPQSAAALAERQPGTGDQCRRAAIDRVARLSGVI
jgi:hypothetical protein